MPNPSRDKTSKGRWATGNKARMSHGVYSFLALGRAPAGCGYVFRMIGQFKRAVEADVAERYGEISIYHAALIQTACRHEGRAQLLTRKLRQCEAELSHADQLATLKEIGNASDSRDKCLKLLGLDDAGRREDVLASLYGPHRANDLESERTDDL